MAATPPEQKPGANERVSALVSEYFSRWKAGEEMTPAQFASHYPDIAEELRLCLEGLTLVDRARTVVQAETTATQDKPSGAPDLPHIPGSGSTLQIVLDLLLGNIHPGELIEFITIGIGCLLNSDLPLDAQFQQSQFLF